MFTVAMVLNSTPFIQWTEQSPKEISTTYFQILCPCIITQTRAGLWTFLWGTALIVNWPSPLWDSRTSFPKTVCMKKAAKQARSLGAFSSFCFLSVAVILQVLALTFSPKWWTVTWNPKPNKPFPPLCCLLSGYLSQDKWNREHYCLSHCSIAVRRHCDQGIKESI